MLTSWASYVIWKFKRMCLVVGRSPMQLQCEQYLNVWTETARIHSKVQSVQYWISSTLLFLVIFLEMFKIQLCSFFLGCRKHKTNIFQDTSVHNGYCTSWDNEHSYSLLLHKFMMSSVHNLYLIQHVGDQLTSLSCGLSQGQNNHIKTTWLVR